MTREISHTPIPSAEFTSHGAHDEIELICHECDLNVHVEGTHLLSLLLVIDAEHERLHRQRFRLRQRREEGTS